MFSLLLLLTFHHLTQVMGWGAGHQSEQGNFHCWMEFNLFCSQLSFLFQLPIFLFRLVQCLSHCVFCQIAKGDKYFVSFLKMLMKCS